MGQINYVKRWVLEPAARLAETFREEMDNWRGGGPPTPMHPSPAGDDALLRRSSKKAEGKPGVS
jgi:hypothetical protein